MTQTKPRLRPRRCPSCGRHLVSWDLWAYRNTADPFRKYCGRCKDKEGNHDEGSP
jgi:hypothetical protein